MPNEQPKKKFEPPRNLKVPPLNRAPEERPTKPGPPEHAATGLTPNLAAAEASGSPEPKAARNPLRKHSLLGMADEIEANAAAATPLLGKIVMRGQATMIYADPNAGKTLTAIRLVLDAIEAKRIAPEKVYYINADDSSEGLAVKLRLFQDVGVHVLAPGFNGFRTDNLVTLMLEAIENGSAHGVCIIVDTYKKFTDLMDKRRTTECNKVVRQWVMAGGTFLALGHTTKKRKDDGTPQYQGTTDVLEDFDAVYVGQVFVPKAERVHRVVKFTRLKSRADSPETVAYAYSTERGISYDMKVASVQSIDPDDLDDYAPQKEDVSEPRLLHAIVQLIGEAGWTEGKMKLAKAAAEVCGVSVRTVLDIVERHTGTVPREHLWASKTGPRGVRIYRLIDQSKPGS